MKKRNRLRYLWLSFKALADTAKQLVSVYVGADRQAGEEVGKLEKAWASKRQPQAVFDI